MLIYIKSLVAALTFVRSLLVNIPIIVITFAGRRYDDDTVARVIASLAISDIGTGTVAALGAVVSASLPFNSSLPQPLCTVANVAIYTFGVSSVWHLSLASVVKAVVICRPLTYFTIFTQRAVTASLIGVWMVAIVFAMAIVLNAEFSSFNWVTLLPIFVTRSDHCLLLKPAMCRLNTMRAFRFCRKVCNRQTRKIASAC